MYAIRSYYEIATDPHLTYVQIGERLLTWIWNTIYDGIDLDVESLDMVKHAAQKAPIVYIPCHKSHIDYLVLSYLLYRHNLNLPLVAAGKNLSFWPLGPFFRKSGAFFIRRSRITSYNVCYTKLLRCILWALRGSVSRRYTSRITSYNVCYTKLLRDNDPIKERIKVVLGEDGEGNPLEKVVFPAKKGGKIQAVAFSAAAKGYHDLIEVMVGVSPDGKLTGISIMTRNNFV